MNSKKGKHLQPITEPGIVPELGVYKQKGYIVSKDPAFLVLNYSGLRISLSKQDLFTDGKKCDENQWNNLFQGCNIYFDALPLVTYTAMKNRATCGWIGRSPDLVQRFPFSFDVDEVPTTAVVQDAYGKYLPAQVVYFPNPDIAVCKIKWKSFWKLSIVSKKMWRQVDGICQQELTLGDVLSIGDYISVYPVRINSPDTQSWFCRTPCYTPDQNITNAEIKAKSTPAISTLSLADKKDRRDQTSQLGLSELPKETPSCIFSKNGETGLFSCLKNPTVGVLLYRDWWVEFDKEDCFFESLEWNDLEHKMQNLLLKFEAVKITDPDRHYRALCVWDVRKPTLQARYERLNAFTHPHIKEKIFQNSDKQTVQGCVFSFALPSIAFVNVSKNDMKFCVMVYSSSLKTAHRADSMISSALHIGDVLEVKISRKKRSAISASHVISKPTKSNVVSFTIRNRSNKYADGEGYLAAKLSPDEAIFYVQDKGPVCLQIIDYKKKKGYVVFMKRTNVFWDGEVCRKWEDILGKELRVLSCRKLDLPREASQEGICAIPLDCEVLDICKILSPVSLDPSLNYVGRVAQFFSFDTVIVRCEVTDQIVFHIMLTTDVLCGIHKTGAGRFQFIGCYLLLGDYVTMKLEKVEGDFYDFYIATEAQKILSYKSNEGKEFSDPNYPLVTDKINAVDCEVADNQVRNTSQDTSKLLTYVIGSGNITNCLDTSSCIVTSETGKKVLIKKEVLYYNGEPCQDLNISDVYFGNFVIDFEANLDQNQRIGYDYVADCAWIKRKFSITELIKYKLYLKDSQSIFRNFKGSYAATVVELIPPKFSVVSVQVENVGCVLALLPLKAIDSLENDVIQNLILVGDFLQVELQSRDVGGHHPILFVINARVLKESTLSSCFSHLLQASGKVVELLNDFEGIVEVDVLSLKIKFHLRDFVFWDFQESDRDKTLPDLSPVGSVLMFNAKKEISSQYFFQATEVWKTMCLLKDGLFESSSLE